MISQFRDPNHNLFVPLMNAILFLIRTLAGLLFLESRKESRKGDRSFFFFTMKNV